MQFRYRSTAVNRETGRARNANYILETEACPAFIASNPDRYGKSIDFEENAKDMLFDTGYSAKRHASGLEEMLREAKVTTAH